PIFKGDRNHFSHRLLALGLSTRQALATVCAIALAMGLGALLIRGSSTFGALILIAQALLVFSVILVLEKAGSRRSGGTADPH
ncbi:MAG: hypothetical protein HQL31_12020, partial [Planctomycetes bacterium]|nr:hypothetical protein [Planctomycetota bacterium]